MPEEKIPETHGPQSVDDGTPLPHLELDDLMNVKMQITADLGQSTMKVREIIALRTGSIVVLDKMAGELTDIRVNGLTLARGEVVVISDTLHVRMSEIVGGSSPLEEEDA